MYNFIYLINLFLWNEGSRTTFSGGEERGHQARGAEARGSPKSRRKQEAAGRPRKGAEAQRRAGGREEKESEGDCYNVSCVWVGLFFYFTLQDKDWVPSLLNFRCDYFLKRLFSHRL